MAFRLLDAEMSTAKDAIKNGQQYDHADDTKHHPEISHSDASVLDIRCVSHRFDLIEIVALGLLGPKVTSSENDAGYGHDKYHRCDSKHHPENCHHRLPRSTSAASATSIRIHRDSGVVIAPHQDDRVPNTCSGSLR